MSNVDIDVNDVVNGLLEQVAGLSRENAILKAQVSALNRQSEKGSEDASDTV